MTASTATPTAEVGTKRGPGRPKATDGATVNGESEASDLLRCFVVVGRLGNGKPDLAVRSSLAKAISVAIQLDAQTENGTKKYDSVKVFQMRSSNVAFDVNGDDDED